MIKLVRRFGGNESGETLIAFAFVMPILLAITFATLDFTLAADGIAFSTPRIVAIDLRLEVAVIVAVLMDYYAWRQA